MKIVAWVIGILVIVVVAVVAYVVLNAGNLVKSGIEEIGPQYLGADITVDRVLLSAQTGTARVKGLRIGNPEGFAGAYAMKLDDVKVVLDYGQISPSLVVLKEVRVDGADLAAVAQGRRTNFQQLMDTLDRTIGPSDEEPKIIIDDLSFTNSKASLDSDLLGRVQLDIPDIRLRDLGRKTNGATGAEIAQQVLRPLTRAITSEAVNRGLDLDGVKKQVEDKIKERISSGLKGLTERLRR